MRFSSVVDWCGTAIVAVVLGIVHYWKVSFFVFGCVVVLWTWHLLHPHPQVDQLLSSAVLTLPILFGFSIEIVPKNVRENPYYRLCVAVFGIALSALIWFQMSRADRIAKGDRESAIAETATRVSGTVSESVSKSVTKAVNEQYAQTINSLHTEIGSLQAQLLAQGKKVDVIQQSNFVTGKIPFG
jgi:hypothetical protein